MDLPGFICFIWSIIFCIMCIVYKFTTLKEWDIFQPVTEETWRNTPKGLILLPPLLALTWPTSSETFTYEPLPMFFWQRLALLVLGLIVGKFIARAIQSKT